MVLLETGPGESHSRVVSLAMRCTYFPGRFNIASTDVMTARAIELG